jgi:flagella basal body P-ring formation protein FlgA
MMHRFTAFVVALLCCASLADARAVAAQGARQLYGATPAQATSTLAMTPASPASPSTSRAGRTPVAAHEIARGTVLAAADIAWSDSVQTHSGARDSVEAGWVARRTFRTGEVLEAPGVSPPDLVSSGDVVNVIYTAPGIALTLHGTAVGSGAKGDEVYVRLDNRRRLRGVVAAANTVRVM